jgi:DNA-binding transcriptional MocR family regulator
MQRIYKKRMLVALSSMRSELKFDGVIWNEPAGGYLIWLNLRNLDLPEGELCDILLKHGVRVSRGSQYYQKNPPGCFIRLSISKLNEDEIVEGIKRLARGIGEAYTSKRRVSAIRSDRKT